jgi:hypothetical protein
VDHVPDPLLLRKSGSAGNRTRTSGSVVSNSDHKTTEARSYKTEKHVNIFEYNTFIFISFEISPDIRMVTMNETVPLAL